MKLSAALISKLCVGVASCIVVFSAPGDQVVMQNGDHYNGRVVSVNTNALVLQSDVLGTVTLPRRTVTVITLGAEPATNASRLAAVVPARAPSLATTNAASDLSAQLRQLAVHTNLINQVGEQFLASSPEANAKFNQMLNDLSTGKLNVAGLRAEARSVADQLRSLEKDTGDDAGGAMDMYLSVLDNFLRESSPSGEAATTATNNSLPKTKPAPQRE